MKPTAAAVDDGRTGRLLTGLALALVVAGMLPTLDGPWQRSWLGHNGARYAHMARNYARWGLFHRGGTPLEDTTGQAADRPIVYAHHPPGVSWTVGAVFGVLGVGERQARAVPALATLASVVLLAWLVGRAAGPTAGGLAALMVAAMPMTSIYGAHVEVQGPPVLAAGLGVLVAYVRWREGGSLLPWLAVSALASFFDWWGLYATAGCALHLGWTRRDRWPAALGLALWTSALFFAWLLWLGHRPGMTVGDVFGAAGVRGAGSLFTEEWPVQRYLAAWVPNTLSLIPGWPLLLVLAVVVAVRGARSERSSAVLGARGLTLLLVVPPVVHGALFPAGMLMHDYWLFGLPTGLAAVLALALSSAGRRLAVGGATAMVALGAALYAPATLPQDVMPALVGQALAAQTAPGDAVLTNYDVNVLLEDGDGDEFVAMRPEVTYYSDRPVRGGVASPAALERALERRPDARWFLLMPWPEAPTEELVASVRERSAGDGVQLSGDPPVWLYPLAR